MSKAESSSVVSRELIATHRQWVLDLSKQLGITVTQIAKQAGLAPTTLTRLASVEDHPHALSSTTIDRIVRTFGVSPPIAPDLVAFRSAVAQTISALHRQSALQFATPEQMASAVLNLADWLLKAGEKGAADQFEAVVSFEVERLKARGFT